MGRAPCCEKNGLKRGPWTPEEDQKLIDYIQKHGSGNWRTLPRNAGLQRCGKSCRLRWTNYLRPDIKRGRFSFEEEETIIQLHSILGNKWSAIAARLPGRTDNEIKNYWNTHIRKRLLRMGIDPVTHSPRLDLLDLSSILSSSQINLSRLLGVQSLVNPEILRLASSLVSSQHQNQNFFLPNGQENQLQVQNQFQEGLVQENQFRSQIGQEVPTTCTSLATTPCVPFPSEASLIMDANEKHYPSGISNDFSPQLSLDWQSQTGMASNPIDDYVTLPSYYNSYSYGSDQGTLLDPSSESSTFISNNMTSNDGNIGFVSVLSTPSSSPPPLNSNYINSGSTSTEDERESYSSNVMKFEIPSDILDGSNFLYCEKLN